MHTEPPNSLARASVAELDDLPAALEDFAVHVERPRQRTPYPHAAIVAKMKQADAEGAGRLLGNHIQRATQALIEDALRLNLEPVWEKRDD